MTLSEPLREALAGRGDPLVGCFAGLADPYASEIVAGAGFDWIVVDMEHAPNDLRTVLTQLQVHAAYPVHTIVRPPIGETHILKQLLDLGVTSFLLPMVESAAQAAALVSAVRYPPRGVRGVGTALARAARWHRTADYLATADAGIACIMQIESAAGLANLDAIAAVDGVDALFIGPADLSASLGHLGQPSHPDVERAIDDAIRRIVGSGTAAGILAGDEARQRHYASLGCRMVGVGVDTLALAHATRAMATAGRAAVARR